MKKHGGIIIFGIIILIIIGVGAQYLSMTHQSIPRLTESQIELSALGYLKQIKVDSSDYLSVHDIRIEKVDGKQAYGFAAEKYLNSGSSDGFWWLATIINNKWEVVGTYKGYDIQCDELISKYKFELPFLENVGIFCHFDGE